MFTFMIIFLELCVKELGCKYFEMEEFFCKKVKGENGNLSNNKANNLCIFKHAAFAFKIKFCKVFL